MARNEYAFNGTEFDLDRTNEHFCDLGATLEAMLELFASDEMSAATWVEGCARLKAISFEAEREVNSLFGLMSPTPSVYTEPTLADVADRYSICDFDRELEEDFPEECWER